MRIELSSVALGTMLALGPVGVRAQDVVPAPAVAAPESVSSKTPDARPPLLLEVWQNGKELGQVVTFFERAPGIVEATEEEWAALGVLDPTSSQLMKTPEEVGVEATWDNATQRIFLVRPVSSLPVQRLSARSLSGKASPAVAGAMVGYDFAVSKTQGSPIASSLGHQIRVALGNTALSHSGQLNHGGAGNAYRRGFSSLQYDDVSRELSWQAGDVGMGATRWSSPVVLGGVRLQKTFGLRPQMPTYPLPALGGIASSNSVVDLYLNQVQQGSTPVAPGPFQWEQYPLLRGANAVDLVVRDEFGRSASTSQTIYFTPELLAKGLQDWSIEVGAPRVGNEDRYSNEMVAAGTIRRGLSDRWTMEAHGEAAGDWSNAGVGSIGSLGAAGLVGAFVSSSRGPQGSAKGWGGFYDYQGPAWSFRVDRSRRQALWTDVVGTDPQPLSELGVGVGWHDRAGRLSLSARYTEKERAGNLNRLAQVQAQWNRGPVGWSAGLVHSLEDPGQPTAWVGMQYSFDRSSISASAMRPQGAPLQERVDGYWSEDGGRYQNRVQAGLIHTRGAGVDGRAEWAVRAPSVDLRIEAGVSAQSGFANFGAAGSAWVSRDAVQLLRSSPDSFVVVRTPGLEGVPVLLENREVGKTNKNGVLVVGELQSLQKNKIDVDIRQVEGGSQIDGETKFVVPRRLLGAQAVFATAVDKSLGLSLVGLDGAAIEAGLAVHTEREDTVVGYDGLVFLTQAEPGLKVEVEGLCSIALPTPLPTWQSDPPQLKCVSTPQEVAE